MVMVKAGLPFRDNFGGHQHPLNSRKSKQMCKSQNKCIASTHNVAKYGPTLANSHLHTNTVESTFTPHLPTLVELHHTFSLP